MTRRTIAARAAGLLLAVAFLAPLVASPAYATGVGKIQAIVIQVLDSLGVTTAGVYTPPASDLASVLVEGNTADGTNIDLDGNPVSEGVRFGDDTAADRPILFGVSAAAGDSVILRGGASATGNAGDSSLVGGSSSGGNGNGGNVSLAGGVPNGSGAEGSVKVQDSAGAHDVFLDIESDGVLDVNATSHPAAPDGTVRAASLKGNSLTLDLANGDVVLARSAAGIAVLSNGPEADGDGALLLTEVKSPTSTTLSLSTTTAGSAVNLRPGDTFNALSVTATAITLGANVNMAGSAFTNTNPKVNDDIGMAYGSGSDVIVQGELNSGIVDNTLTTVLTVNTGPGDYSFVILEYGLYFAASGEVCQEAGTVTFAITNDATSGRGASAPGEISVQYLTAGESLTTAWTVDTSADAVLIQLTADATMDGGAPGSATLRWKATFAGDVTLTVP